MIKTVAHNNYDGTWRIETTSGKEILVDEDDLDVLMRHSWSVSNTGYAQAKIAGHVRHMHRFLLGIADTNIQVDHINGDKLDNRRCNLRTCTKAENMQNRGLHKNNKSGHAGVEIRKCGFCAKIKVNNKCIWLGTYKTFEEAVKVRVAAEIQYYGEFAPNGRNERVCGFAS